MEAKILPIHGLDHFRIGLDIWEDSSPERCPFKLEAMWLRDDGFKELVGWWLASAPSFEGNDVFIFFKIL